MDIVRSQSKKAAGMKTLSETYFQRMQEKQRGSGLREMSSSSHCLPFKDRHLIGLRAEIKKKKEVQLLHHPFLIQ